MKILMLSYSDSLGGAARAAYRIHRSVLKAGASSELIVRHKGTDDFTVRGPQSPREKAFDLVRRKVGQGLANILRKENPALHSLAALPSRELVNTINRLDADLVHLHWVCNELLSIEDISRIEKPLIWTLHDMWPFCGAEHLAADERWKTGYSAANRPNHESGPDLNRWVWNRKRRAWKHPIRIVAPSTWLKDCVASSSLMRNWPVSVIPIPIDPVAWAPVDSSSARMLLGLPPTPLIVAFGAIGGTSDSNKGFDLLQIALDHLKNLDLKIELVIFGQGRPEYPPDLGFPIHYAGHLRDDLSLRVLYSAADVLVVPSRIEAFGQTALESMACGTPVVAFDASGLSDLVDHKHTGWLARAFDVEDLARGLAWVIEDKPRNEALGRQARARVLELFSDSVVSSEYLSAYRSILAAR